MPDGVWTIAFCLTRLPSSADPIGDSFEILPAPGLASIRRELDLERSAGVAAMRRALAGA